MDDIKNILFITTDQQRRDSLPCYGLDFMQTPALDSLAREGVVFENCSAVSPVCQPARASFMIGQYPHVTGIPDNFRWIRPNSPTIARSFSEAGFRTAAIGKMHFHPWEAMEGFQERIIAEDKRHIFRPDHWTRFLEERGYKREHPAMVPGYGKNLGAIASPLPGHLHIDSFVGDQAVKWIEGYGQQKADKKKPFFTWVSFNSPHDPYDPPEELVHLYAQAPIPEAVGSLQELEHKPAYQRAIIPTYKQNLLYLSDYATLDPQKIRRIREYYLASVTWVDRQIAWILEALEKADLLESTLIVFSSDHGDNLGDHGLPFKSNFYEGALLVPLIVRGPGIPPGRRNSSPVNWLDLHATFLRLAGIPLPDHIQGEDISPLWQEPERIAKTEAFSELLGSVMVRTDRAKLVLCDDGDGELYDLKEEPLEVNNHYLDPAYAPLKEELSRKIAAHLISHSRVRSFGGGRHGSDEQRDLCFAEIRERLACGGYPGLDRRGT